jgi:DNA-binding LacI/PurR family transcriptional regulator
MIENHITSASSVCTDSVAGGAIAAQHLIDRGRKKIGIVSGSVEGDFGSALARYNGFLEVKQTQGAHLAPPDFIKINDYSFEEGQRCFQTILDHNLDGVFCAAGDWVAMGILDCAKKQGIKIPDRFALVAYDNIIASGLISPALTTISQPLETIGRHALALCIDALKSDTFELVHTVYKPELVIRETS